MSELRWVLLGLGAVVLLAVYALGKGILRWPRLSRRKPRGPVEWVEPSLESKEPAEDDARSEPGLESDQSPPDLPPDPPPVPERVVTVRFIPNEKWIACDRVVLALRSAGLRHGRYGIFHLHESEFSDEPVFSVANLTEPGSFDLNNLADKRIPGMSFFLVLPGKGDPVLRFDRMVETARTLARDLGAELHDEKGSSWSIQRERYVREEMIQYRHQLMRAEDIQ